MQKKYHGELLFLSTLTIKIFFLDRVSPPFLSENVRVEGGVDISKKVHT